MKNKTCDICGGEEITGVSTSKITKKIIDGKVLNICFVCGWQLEIEDLRLEFELLREKVYEKDDFIDLLLKENKRLNNELLKKQIFAQPESETSKSLDKKVDKILEGMGGGDFGASNKSKTSRASRKND